YTVTVTDSNGVTRTTTIIVNEPAVLTATITKTDASCNGNLDGLLDLTVSGGTTPFTFVWSNGATTEDLINLTIGSYNVTITDAYGCTVSAGASITEPAVLNLSTTATDPLRNGCTNGGINLTVSGGTAAY